MDGAAGGETNFFNSSSAGTGTFTTNGGTTVSGASCGVVEFFNTSTAGSGTFTTNGTAVTGALGGATLFLDTSTAGNGSFTTNGGASWQLSWLVTNNQNVFTGWTIIAGETTVDETGNANTGSATVKVYDPNGVLLVSLCAETAGTRFEL